MPLPSGASDGKSGAVAFQENRTSPDTLSQASQSSRHFVIFVLFAVSAFVLTNFLISIARLPRYASWTGVRTLEDKLDTLSQFARHGTIDAVLLGSSIVDFGVSAEALSEEVSQQSGKSYRAFNFSTGAATLRTFPLLYRLIRTTTKPKALFLIVPVELDLKEVVSPKRPEQILLRSPIAASLHNSFLLAISKEIWSVPLVRFAGPLRDLALHGAYKNRVATHADVYELGPNGDTFSFNVNTDRQGFLKVFEQRRRLVLKQHSTHLAKSEIKGLQDLANMAKNDGVSLTVIAHDSASALALQDSAYTTALKPYYDEIVRTVPMKLVDFVEEFVPAPFEISDPVHLNQYGARRFARLLATKLLGRNGAPEPDFKAPDFRPQSQDPTFSPWSAVVTRRSKEPSGVLELEFVQTWQTPPLLPGEGVQIAVRTPDNLDIICQSKVLRPGLLQAEASSLPAGDNVFWIRVVPDRSTKGPGINLPLARFRWLEVNSAFAFRRSQDFRLRSLSDGG